MPISTPIPDANKYHFQVVMKGVMAAAGSTSVDTVSIFNFRRTSNVNPLSKTNINTAFQAGIGAAVAAAVNARWAATLNQIRCTDDATDAYGDFTSTAVGAITGDSMASDDTAFLYLKTGIRGRAYNGRKFVGPMSESDSTTNGDVFNSGCLTRLAAIGTAIVNGFTDSDGNVWKSQVLSVKYSVLDSNPTNVQAWDISSALVNHRIGTLLRRKVRSVY